MSKRPFSYAGILISLLVAGSACSNKAHASCGDYVHSRQSQALEQQSHDHTAEVGYGNAANHRFADVPRLPSPMPCFGPGCHRSSRPESLPPWLPLHRVRLNDSLMVSHQVNSPESMRAFCVVPTCEGHAKLGFPQLIEIPPEVVC